MLKIVLKIKIWSKGLIGILTNKHGEKLKMSNSPIRKSTLTSVLWRKHKAM